MDKFIIFGADKLAVQVFEYIRREEGRLAAAFVVDEKYKKTDELMGRDVVAGEKMAKRFPPGEYGAYVAIGYSGMNTGRKAVAERLRSSGYELLNYVHPSAVNYAKQMGGGNIIFPGVILDIDVVLGDCNVFAYNAVLSHDVTVGDYNFFGSTSFIGGFTDIGDNCFIGANSTINNGIKVSSFTLAGAGAFINKSTREKAVMAAKPSQRLKGVESTDVISFVE